MCARPKVTPKSAPKKSTSGRKTADSRMTASAPQANAKKTGKERQRQSGGCGVAFACGCGSGPAAFSAPPPPPRWRRRLRLLLDRSSTITFASGSDGARHAAERREV